MSVGGELPGTEFATVSSAGGVGDVATIDRNGDEASDPGTISDWRDMLAAARENSPEIRKMKRDIPAAADRPEAVILTHKWTRENWCRTACIHVRHIETARCPPGHSLTL